MTRMLAWLSHPDRRWTVLGIALMTAGGMGMGASIIYTNSYKPTGDWIALGRHQQVSNRIMWTSMIVLLAGQFVITFQGSRNARRKRRAAKGLCLECGYDLRESPTRCPECGTDAPTPLKS